jgi:putative colanic acid biosynthesis UDP-glucose lipid carrier transferase
MLKHTTEYSQLYDNYMLRHYNRPGITGWAQVNGYRGEIKESEQLRKRVEHDIWYMENWNIWLDFKILYLTAVKTLCGDENAF